MRLGIDFGTTRTVVAAEDRGNYPLIAFRDAKGGWAEWFPSRVAARDGALYYGHAAEALVGVEGAWHLGPVKRLLGRLAPDATVDVPGVGQVATARILTEFLVALRESLFDGSAGMTATPGETLRAMISVPANANSNQRFLTIEAFRQAGFEVAGVLNEPSAAGVEYAHRYLRRAEAPKSKEHLAVYDLGGGTFDAAAIRIAGMRHEVVASEGAEQLGGEDFDRILLDMVVESLGGNVLDAASMSALLEECRERKESLNPNTKRLLVDTSAAGGDEVVLDVREYYERCAPLVDRTIALLELVLDRLPTSDEPGLPPSVATVYLVGGSVAFPPIARVLKERYGRRVQRSPYPHGAVAIGLAVAANETEPYFIRETLTRHFGVWREADEGVRVVFDPIFRKDEALGEGEGLRAVRRYRPAHTVGHFRFLECSALAEDGEPTADLTPWGAITFPFAARLQRENGSADLTVERTAESADAVTETYVCDPTGVVSVTVRDEGTGFEKTYRLAGDAATPGS